MRRSAVASCLCSLALAPEAVAQTNDAAPNVLIEITEAASVLYNVNNRDTRAGVVASAANDDWGLFYNRLNIQATTGQLTLSVRLDGAWFFASPSPGDVASRLAGIESFETAAARAEFLEENTSAAGGELSNRYIDWVYPAKYTLLYTHRDLEVAVGDSTAQLGRGLVLSVRKLDELSSDTTVRGIRATGRARVGDTRLKLTALAGSLNPLRIDEASGRYLGVHSSVTHGLLALTEAGMPRAVETDFVPGADSCARFGTCSYAPDRVVAGGFEVAAFPVTLGTQASVLFRQEALSKDVVSTANRVTTASQSVEFPKVLENGSLYVEAAVQKLTHEDDDEPRLDTGHAVYLAASWAEERFSLLAEGKHYRRFFPLAANVSAARAREFSLLQYSAPPTTEEIWNDTQLGSFNTCVTGGRLRADAHFTKSHTVYGWVGHYATFAESVTNADCDTRAENANRVWDSAIGLEISRPKIPVKADFLLGTRFDASDRELSTRGGPTHAFYREAYVRYDVTAPIHGPFSFELQGFHRRRRETVGGPESSWLEGQHSTGVDWGERLSFAFGVEYDTRPNTPTHYFNLMSAFRPSDAVSLGLFVGQRRGALRCVGGVCRVYPPFEGGRLDVTVRY